MSIYLENPTLYHSTETTKINNTKSKIPYESESDYSDSNDGFSNNDVSAAVELYKNKEDSKKVIGIHNDVIRHNQCEYAPVYIVSNDVEQGGKEIDVNDLQVVFLKLRVAQSSIGIRLGFIRKVYLLLTMQILITACIGAAFMFTPNMKNFLRTNIWLLFASIVGSIILLIPLYCLRKRTPTNFILLTAFTITQSFTIGMVITFYPKIVILKALVITLLVLGSLTIYACQSKHDFSGYYSSLFAFLIILLGLGVMQIYIWSPIIELFIGFLGACLFCIFIIVDTTFIMKRLSPEEYILATITLYLDVLHLFLYILRIISILTRR